MSFDAIESYKAELRDAGIDINRLAMCAEGAISHASMVEGQLLEARTLLGRMEMNLAGQSEKIVQLIHERNEAREACDKSEREHDAAHRANICDACGGSGVPVSGPGCMCGGSGKMSDAAHYLRERYAAEKIRADNLQNQLNCWLLDVPPRPDANRNVKIPSLESENTELRAQLARLEVENDAVTSAARDTHDECVAMRHSRDGAQKTTDAALIQLGKVGRALRDLLVALKANDVLVVNEKMKEAEALLPPETLPPHPHTPETP